jgi:hypothetical protein
MANTQQPEEPSLRPEEIQSEVFRRLKRYENLNFLEQVAMFCSSRAFGRLAALAGLHCGGIVAHI